MDGIGTRWGHVQITNLGQDTITAKGRMGEYDTGERGPEWWNLKCDCGHEWRIFKHEFSGKRLVRSCGRKECTVKGKKESRPIGRPRQSGEYRIPIIMNAPISLRERVEQYQIEKGISSLSQALVRLVTERLDEIDKENETK